MYFDVHRDKCDHLSQAREGDGMMTIIMIISMITMVFIMIINMIIVMITIIIMIPGRWSLYKCR